LLQALHSQNIKSPKIERAQNAKTPKKQNPKTAYFVKKKQNPNMIKMGFNIYPS
jgi:hypothetical protein